MSFKRKLTKYERQHLEQPSFLERYFQKKAVWIGTLIILTPLIVWGMSVAVLDLLKIIDDSDFGFYQDIFMIFCFVACAPFVVQEYKFYEKHLWSKKHSKAKVLTK